MLVGQGRQGSRCQPLDASIYLRGAGGVFDRCRVVCKAIIMARLKGLAAMAAGDRFARR